MTVATGTGLGNTSIQQVFSLGSSFYLLTVGDTQISANSTAGLGNVVINGSGFTWSSSVVNGTTFYQLTGGTITSVSYTNGASNQTWTGLSVSAAAAFNALGDTNAFSNLFFGGNDTFNWTPANTSNGSTLAGFNGDDTFNLSNYSSINLIDGGSGNDTINLSGGLGSQYQFSSPTVFDSNSGNSSDFSISNIETVNLAAGSNYTIIAAHDVVATGNTLTIDGSHLGPSDRLIFNTNTGGQAFWVVTGNLVLLGGAGDDILEGGTGTNTFNGGGGNNTVDFGFGQQRFGSGATGVTADLSNPGLQNFGTGFGSGTFTNIQNLTGTPWNDTLTGDNGDNIISGGGDPVNAYGSGSDTMSGGGGNDTFIVYSGNTVYHTTVDGGTGTDTVVLNRARSGYTLSVSGGTITLTDTSGYASTITLTNVEYAKFTDQTLALFGPMVTTSNLSASRNQTIAASSLFSVSDFNGSAITEYQFYDNTTDPLSGHFVLGGVTEPAGTTIDIAASQLSQLSFVTGKVGDTLQVRAFDGTYWSAADTASWAPFTVSVPPDVPPAVGTNNLTKTHFQTLPLSSLFTVSDADGDTITRYQIYDNTGDPNSGHFVVNGVAQAAGQVIDLTPDQVAQTSFVTGTVGDTLQIRAFDGMQWSAADNANWAPFTITVTPNYPPIVTTTLTRLAAGQSVPLSSLVSIYDGDGDTMTRYQLYDNTSDPNSGHFVVNGVAQPAGTVIDLTAAQAAQTTFVTGTVNDDLQIRAYDGFAWSAADNAAWSPFTIGPTADNPAHVQSTAIGLPHNSGGVVDVGGYVFASDPDGDVITQFQVLDTGTTPGGGYLTLNGVVQPAGTPVTVAAKNYAGGIYTPDPSVALDYVPGQASETLQVRAFDGIEWSSPDNGPWTPFTINIQNNPPVVTTINVAAGGHNQTLPVASLFSVSDADGDPITAYQLLDSSTAPNSGHFVVNGQVQTAGAVVNITAAQLSQTSFVTGNTNDTLQIRAFDGGAWSAPDNGPWSPFTVSVGANAAPAVTTANITRPHFQTYSLASLLTSVSDPDGDPIVRYQLYDATSDPNSGHFMLNGQALPAGQVIDLTAAQAAQTSFVTGTVGDNLQVRVSDGLAWSAADSANWAPFTITVPANHAPVVTTQTERVAAGQTIALSSLISVSDADGDAMTRYQLYDNSSDPNSGHFVVNGVVQPAHQTIDLTAAQAAQTSFVTGTVDDDLQIRAFDGISWSAADSANWAPFTVGPLVNHPPVVTTGKVTALRGQTIALSNLISVSDADGDTMTRYQLYDATSDPNSGHFMLNGQALPAGTVIDLTAAQAAQTTFVTGRVNDNLQIRAFDGISWSAADSADWAPFTVTVPPNNAPVVTTTDTRVAAGQTIALSNLISVSDADGDTMTRYQLYDNTRDPNSGYFMLNGQALPAGAVIDLTAAQAAQTTFVTGTVSDNLQIRVFDGQAWSADYNANWAPFNIGPTVNHAPVVTTTDTRVAAGQTIALSNLISVSDADGDAMTRYQLYDNTRDPSSGYFMLNGQALPAGTVIDLTAAQAAQTSFVTGTVSDNLQIRVFDGQAWSAADSANWAPFNIGPTVNHAPVLTTADTRVAAGQTIALSNLISVSDADGDAMTRYQLYDNTSDPNSGHFMLNGQALAAKSVIDLTAAQAAQTTFVTGTVSDNLQIRAFDGQAWSAADSADWAPFNIGPTVNHAPVLTTSTVNTQAGQSLALSSLFSVSDADGDAMTRFQLYDDTSAPNSGHFVVNGVAQPANAVIDISAAQLNQTFFVTGSLGDALQIRAFDGRAWSATDTGVWAPFQVNVS
jgi:hypothetical protein